MVGTAPGGTGPIGAMDGVARTGATQGAAVGARIAGAGAGGGQSRGLLPGPRPQLLLPTGAYPYYGYGYNYPYGYGYNYPYGSGLAAAAATAPLAVAAATAEPLMTGRSVAIGNVQMGNYCTTPAKTCLLYNESWVGNGCSCRIPGGRARGSVTP
jgi:hypothetical protein